MIDNLIACMSIVFIMLYGYRHYTEHKRLKAENDLLRQQWKKRLGKV